jgi:hypothetical protein
MHGPDHSKNMRRAVIPLVGAVLGKAALDQTKTDSGVVN